MLLTLFLLLYNIIYAYDGDLTTYGGVITGGSCLFKKMDFTLYYVAMNQPQYSNSLSCGRCLRINYNGKNTDVVVVDKLPEGKNGDIDAFTNTWNVITGIDPNRVKIQWDYINCPVNGNVYLTIDEINYYWLAVRPENFKCGISEVWLNLNNNWVKLIRDDAIMTGFKFIYNGFISGTFKFKIINVNGEIIETSNLNSLVNKIETYKQFSCGSSEHQPTSYTPIDEIVINTDGELINKQKTKTKTVNVLPNGDTVIIECWN